MVKVAPEPPSSADTYLDWSSGADAAQGSLLRLALSATGPEAIAYNYSR